MSVDVRATLERIRTHAQEGQPDLAWEAAAPLVAAVADDEDAAMGLLALVDSEAIEREHRALAVRTVFDAYRERPEFVAAIGDLLDRVHDVDWLNAPAASDALFTDVAARLQRILGSDALDDELRFDVLKALVNVGRLLGRTWDGVVEDTYAALLALRPDAWTVHYNRGLFLKTRGRFAEGLAANQRARELGGDGDQAVMWNLGICATGAGDGATALAVWRSLDQLIEMGRDGLPEGTYPMTKVRLAERPLAERTVDDPDDPGSEETIWVERLSPCHGVVRSALFWDDVGVDFGDIVLFDGAPITFHTYGDQRIPVFPHLATLKRNGYQVFRFAGTQGDEGEVAELSRALPRDAVAYVHTEQYRTLCRSCWSDPNQDHAEHDASDPHHVVGGKLCVPPDLPIAELLEHLDRAVAAAPSIQIYVPGARRAAGDERQADVDQRRFDMLGA